MPARATCLLASLAVASGFSLSAGVSRPVPVAAGRRSVTPTASLDLSVLLALEGEAPQMAEGSIFIAIGGGLLAIATAGIPFLFMQKDEPVTKQSKLEALETAFEGMEIIDAEPTDVPAPPPAPAADDDAPPPTASI